MNNNSDLQNNNTLSKTETENMGDSNGDPCAVVSASKKTINDQQKQQPGSKDEEQNSPNVEQNMIDVEDGDDSTLTRRKSERNAEMYALLSATKMRLTSPELVVKSPLSNKGEETEEDGSNPVKDDDDCKMTILVDADEAAVVRSYGSALLSVAEKADELVTAQKKKKEMGNANEDNSDDNLSSSSDDPLHENADGKDEESNPHTPSVRELISRVKAEQKQHKLQTQQKEGSINPEIQPLLESDSELQPFASYPTVVVVRHDSSPVGKHEDLYDESTATITTTSSTDDLDDTPHSSSNPLTVSTMREWVSSLSLGGHSETTSRSHDPRDDDDDPVFLDWWGQKWHIKDLDTGRGFGIDTRFLKVVPPSSMERRGRAAAKFFRDSWNDVTKPFVYQNRQAVAPNK